MKPLADCRLYAFVDSAYLHDHTPVDLAQQLCDGGADLIQLRAKDWPEEKIRQTAEAIIPITRAAGIPLVINDHWQIATDLEAEICHLGQEDYFESSAPPQPSTFIPQLGLSTHAPEQAARAMETNAAYFAVGPVFPTPTKPGRPGVTLEYVRWAAAHIDRPWFAIGGITLENIDSVLEAGARRICVVSAILNAPDVAHACQQFRERLASVPPQTQQIP
ncbi:MAG: thiamine phosphate synthase [Verrucomicrobia subdivision 3 bacterium]|nr:thiamine phosphate synthase [Limisphaerales bacterium]